MDPSHSQPVIVPDKSELHKLIHARILNDSLLCRSQACSHRCYEFTSAMALPFLTNTVSWHTSPDNDSYGLSVSSSLMIPELPGAECDIDVPFRTIFIIIGLMYIPYSKCNADFRVC